MFRVRVRVRIRVRVSVPVGVKGWVRVTPNLTGGWKFGLGLGRTFR